MTYGVKWGQGMNCGISDLFCQARHNSPPDPHSSWSYLFASIHDESDLAQQAAAELFPEDSTLETSMAVEHEGPLILISPSNLSSQPSE